MSEHIKKQIETMCQQLKELSAIYHNAASSSGMSDNEFWVLYALLILGGEYSQQDICDMWSLPKQTVNSVVSNLSKKGYLHLETVPGTRNRKIIHLSADGKNYGENAVTSIYEAELRSLGKMSEQERLTFITLLGKYIALLRNDLEGSRTVD